MSDPTTTQPIVVHATPTPVQIAAALRSAVVAVGPLLGLAGYQGAVGDASPLLTYIGPASAVIAFLWGQYATWKHAKQAAAMANALPNRVASTK